MFTFKVVIVFTACLAWSFCAENKYCSLCKDHTMCKYTGVGPECKKSGHSGVSESEKKEILDVHNRIRRTVATGKEKRGASGGQPKAANLRKFVWDDELAKVAQRWADQCRFGHDSCRRDPRWYVGQNVHWKSQSLIKPVNWTKNIMDWYSEVDKFNPKDLNKYSFNPETGHYTQLLWYETYAIGCGRRDYGHEQLSVCNYGPGGNVLGSKIYTIGEPCSRCPKGTICEDSLCAARTLNPRSEILQEHETNSYWRSNIITEEGNSTEEKSLESNPAKNSSLEEEKSIESNPAKNSSLEEEISIESNPAKNSSLEEEKSIESNPAKNSSLEEEISIESNPVKNSSLEEEKSVESNPAKNSSLEEEKSIESNPAKNSSLEEEKSIELNPAKNSSLEEEKSIESNPAKNSSLEEEISLQEGLNESNATMNFSLEEVKTEISEEGKTGEGDNDIEIDEKTNEEIKKILVQIENLLKAFVKKANKEKVTINSDIPLIMNLMHSHKFRQLFDNP